jgi:hypothetical protein
MCPLEINKMFLALKYLRSDDELFDLIHNEVVVTPTNLYNTLF